MGSKSSTISSPSSSFAIPKTNVVFIAYNSTITGGKALRVLNEMSSTQDMLYKNESKNMVKSYCENYDKAKKNEPFYDVIASQIASLNQVDFDRNFTYCAANLDEEGSNINSFHPSQPDPLIFKMNSKYIEGKETFTRDNFNEYYKYNNPDTEHLFIYGPLTDSMYEDIENNMKTHISNNTQLVIHLQGENFLNKEGNDGDMIFGIESKGNLFKNSFNYQNCMKNAQKLRKFIQSNSQCESFTILCTSPENLRKNEINGTELSWKSRNGTTSPIIGGIPQIYIDFYEDISNLIQGKLDYNAKFYEKLNITKIYQDMVDKDNSSSVVFLILNSFNSPETHLIGREAFSLLYNKEGVSHHQFLNCAFAPSFLKPDSISQTHNNIELDMTKATDTYWPAFKDTNYELEYSSYDTINHYILMTRCFESSIHNLLECYDKTYDGFCTDFSKNIAKPSDKKNAPLMNEIIFFPALNTLIKSINNIDTTELNKIHSELTEITSNSTYLSNNKLSHLYDQYIVEKYRKLYVNIR
tara:strand:- start:56 stop:1633 length:1578 start_codon:yes stop_codon:yes gene_type:complete